MKLMKRVGQVLALMVVMVIPALLVSPVQASVAPEATTAAGTALFDLVAALVGGESAAKWISALGLVAYLFTQLRALLPTEWLARLPVWLVTVLEWLAGNYGKASNDIINDPVKLRRAD